MTTYSLGSLYRFFIFGGATFIGMGIILTVVHLLTTWEPMPVRVFLVVWIVLAVAGLYSYLFRVSYDLRFDGELLYWKSPLREGRIFVQDLKRVKVRWGTDAVIESADGSRIHILAEKGFAKFAASLAGANPNIVVQIGLLGRLYQWLPGPSRFRV